MAIRVDQLAQAAVISTVQTYNLQRLLSDGSVFELVLNATAAGTSLAISVLASVDNVNFINIYTDASPLTAAKGRRVIFSNAAAAAAVPAESATTDSTIIQPPILEPYIRIVVTPTGSWTVNVAGLFSDRYMG